MATQADFDEFVEAQRSIRTLAVRDLTRWWADVEQLPPGDLRAAAEVVAPALAATYGEVAATVAADYYEEARAAAGAPGSYSARMAESAAASGVLAQVRWAVEPAWSGDRAGALGRLAAVVDRYALQDGKNTMVLNAERDPARPRWARIPVGKTCAWCLMLASRGAVYRSAASAGDAKDFHNEDDCQVHPSWDNGRDLPGSYDQGALFDLYERARAAAGRGTPEPKQILAQIRRLDGGMHVTDGVKPRNH